MTEQASAWIEFNNAMNSAFLLFGGIAIALVAVIWFLSAPHRRNQLRYAIALVGLLLVVAVIPASAAGPDLCGTVSSYNGTYDLSTCIPSGGMNVSVTLQADNVLNGETGGTASEQGRSCDLSNSTGATANISCDLGVVSDGVIDNITTAGAYSVKIYITYDVATATPTGTATPIPPTATPPAEALCTTLQNQTGTLDVSGCLSGGPNPGLDIRQSNIPPGVTSLIVSEGEQTCEIDNYTDGTIAQANCLISLNDDALDYISVNSVPAEVYVVYGQVPTPTPTPQIIVIQPYTDTDIGGTIYLTPTFSYIEIPATGKQIVFVREINLGDVFIAGGIWLALIYLVYIRIRRALGRV